MSMYTLAIVLAHWHDGGSHWWIVFPIFWLLLFAGLIAFFWRRSCGSQRTGDSAKRILAERFARGEISGDEYRDRLAQLQQS